MKRVVWEIKYQTLPHVIKHCKKCGGKREFLCSRQFRVNAQRRNLDVWLIYKCSECDTTWNATVLSRVAPQSIKPELLDGFFQNDEMIVEKYAMDSQFLCDNGVEVGVPEYVVDGDAFSWEEPVELEIKSQYSFPIKVSAIVRDKLGLSQREYLDMIASGVIKSVPTQDLKKCRVKNGIVLMVG